MTTNHQDHAGLPQHPRRRWSFGFTLAVTVVLAGVAWLLTRHTEHVVRYLPFVILLACPLMHVFGHGHGYGGHGSTGAGREKR